MSNIANQTTDFKTVFVDTSFLSRFRRSTHLALIALIACQSFQSSTAFTPYIGCESLRIIYQSKMTTKSRYYFSLLNMSSIGQDPDSEKKVDRFINWMYSKLPDPPEDQISVS